MKEISAVAKFDCPWPRWALGSFCVEYVRDSSDLADDVPSWSLENYDFFSDRPEKVLFEDSDKSSVVIVKDAEKSIGELWLRRALFPKNREKLIAFTCEVYFYRRGWRDDLLAQMDGQKAGKFIMPSRCNDFFCEISNLEQRVFLSDNTLSIRLSRQ